MPAAALPGRPRRASGRARGSGSFRLKLPPASGSVARTSADCPGGDYFDPGGALNGAITGPEAAKLDIIGMLTLGMVTALGGGILRDILINALPPPHSAPGPTWR